MKKIQSVFIFMAVVILLSSCATQQRKRGPKPIVHKPREVVSVHFDFNKSALKSEERSQLDPTINHLKGHRDWVAQVEGHADAIGSSAYNLKLGDKRARSVKEAMEQEGVNPDQLLILSFGEDNPVADNKSDMGRAENRRVEVKVR